MQKREKVTEVSSKIVCSRCGKEDYVSFVADGSRDYYCNECLTEFNKERKRGKVKKVFDEKRKRMVNEFLCDVCEKFIRCVEPPYKKGDQLICPKCKEEMKRSERQQKRKNVVIAQ